MYKLVKILSLCISPEANNIVRSGNGISPRPYLDRDLYHKHIGNCEVEEYPLLPMLCEHLDAAIDLVTIRILYIKYYSCFLNKHNIC